MSELRWQCNLPGNRSTMKQPIPAMRRVASHFRHFPSFLHTEIERLMNQCHIKSTHFSFDKPCSQWQGYALLLATMNTALRLRLNRYGLISYCLASLLWRWHRQLWRLGALVAGLDALLALRCSCGLFCGPTECLAGTLQTEAVDDNGFNGFP